MKPAHYSTRRELTERQREVLRLVARGFTNPQIAEALGISLNGAKFQVSEILDKLDVASREEAAACWNAEHWPTARLRRLLRSLVALPLRWIAMAAVFGCGSVAVAIVIAAIIGTSSPATPRASAVATSTIPATLVPSSGPPPASDATIQPIPLVDFSELPSVDTSGWKTITGPAGTLSVSMPSNWIVTGNTSDGDISGQTVDSISAYRPEPYKIAMGANMPGYTYVNVNTGSRPGEAAYPIGALQEVTIAGLSALQYGQDQQFPDQHGNVIIGMARLPGADGLYLNGFVWVQLPATAEDIATALAVAESAIAK